MLQLCYIWVIAFFYFCDIETWTCYMMAKKAKILIVDDEESIGFVLKLNLELAGFEVDVALSGEEALRLRLERYDLFLLDVMMKHIDGFELAHRLRSIESLKSVPIIFCTAKDSEDDLLQGFAKGADDYIKKPFSMRELVARVRSVLHRSGRLKLDKEETFEGLILCKDERRCQVDGAEVQLTGKEFDLALFLLENRNKVFSRADILNRVWSEDVYVIDRTVDVNIGRLRKKLGNYGKYIVTKQGQGYGFKTTD